MRHSPIAEALARELTSDPFTDDLPRTRGPSARVGAVPGDDERMVEVSGHELRISRPDKVYFPALDATKFDLVSYYLQVGHAPAQHRRRASRHAAALPRRRHRQVLLPEAHPGRRAGLAAVHHRVRRPTARPPTRSSWPTSRTSCGR